MDNAVQASEQVFWDWFAANRDSFLVDDVPEEPVVEALTSALHLYNEELTWEIGRTDDGARQLVISADGNIDAFPSVERLCAAAPAIDGWIVTPFRPAIGLEFCIEYEGITLDPQDILIEPIMTDEALDIIFYIPDFDEDRRELFVGGCFILMDMALGEHDAVKKIRYVDHGPLPEDVEEADLVSLVELPAVVEYYYDARQNN